MQPCGEADTERKVIGCIAFPRQQWLRERASVLHYMYIACLVITEGHEQSEQLR
jgi:hypothetical protein